jgi:hypothetical protein
MLGSFSGVGVAGRTISRIPALLGDGVVGLMEPASRSQHVVSRPFEVTHGPGAFDRAVPMTLGFLTTPLLGLTDTAVVGRLGQAEALAGLAIGAILFDLIYGSLSFFRTATTGLAAQAFGRADERELAGGVLAGHTQRAWARRPDAGVCAGYPLGSARPDDGRSVGSSGRPGLFRHPRHLQPGDLSQLRHPRLRLRPGAAEVRPGAADPVERYEHPAFDHPGPVAWLGALRGVAWGTAAAEVLAARRRPGAGGTPVFRLVRGRPGQTSSTGTS